MYTYLIEEEGGLRERERRERKRGEGENVHLPY